MYEQKKNGLVGKCLSNQVFTEDWEYILETALVFNDWQMGEISLVYPVPEGRGTLVVRDDVPYLTEDSPLEVIKRFFQRHRLMDYYLMRRACQSLPVLPSKKVPIVNAHFGLFPIEAPENSVWLNPLMIANAQALDRDSFVELTNGLSMELPIHRKSLIYLSSRAVYTLATYRQDYSATLLSEGRPLDYVALPATPFGQLLSKQELLQQWLLTPGEFFNQYKYQECVKWYRSLSAKEFELLD